MKYILETERLILREMIDDDFESLKKVIGDSKNMCFYRYHFDDEHVWGWLNWCKKSYAEPNFGLWAVIYKETWEMIGDF